MTHLIIDCENLDFDWTGADGLLAKAGDLAPEKADDLPLLLLRGSPATAPQWVGRPNVYWLAEQGLDAAARLRDLFPGEKFLPAVSAAKPSSHFTMGQHYTGDGFSYYVPDMTTYRTYRIDDGDSYLSDWLERVSALGIDAVMFLSPDAKAEAKGFDLNLLEKAKRLFTGGIVLSGGATEIVHFERLKAEGGCLGALVAQSAALSLGIQQIADLLKPPAEEISRQETEGAAA
ncbi:MAG: hypothetical protein EPN26_03845 [Rhodospirillales bacterium]|nr:MAG: hypothetical protein EPN26_03845 [Rhodospirillales bacterium]